MSQVITLEDLNNYSTESIDPTRGQMVVDGVNDYIERLTGRSWGETATSTERHDFAPVIFLTHSDVTEITSVKSNRPYDSPVTLAPSTYYVNTQGRLVLSEARTRFAAPRRDQVTVTYQYGTADVPGDLELAALAMAADLATFAESGQKEVRSESVGSYNLSYASMSNTAAGKSYSMIINRYRAISL